MRAYEILITDPKTNKEVYKISTDYNGKYDTGSLNIELDIPLTSYDTPWGGSFVRIWGIGLNLIGKSHNFNGMDIKIYGGMAKGLPLANAGQYGLLISANIFQAFGNWQGTSQSLDFILLPKTGSQKSPVNLQLEWLNGTNLVDAALKSLKVAFPNKSVTSSITTQIIASEDIKQTCSSLGQFASLIREYSQSIINKDDYYGIKIGYEDNALYLYDGSTPSSNNSVISNIPVQSTVNIKFNELIGQPTWISPATIQFKTAIRKDLKVGTYVIMPNTLQTTMAQSQSQYRNNSAFQGKFMVSAVRHIGNFRQKDANAWVTTIEAIQTTNL